MSINKGAKIDGDPSGNKIEQEVKDLESAVFETKSKSQAKKAEASIPVPVASDPVTPVASTTVASTMVASTPAADQAEMLTQLLLLMAKREARLNQQEESQVEAAQRKRDAYNRQRSNNTEAERNRQKRCPHLKGGKTRSKGARVDYNLSLHTYISGESVIKCLSCGMKWRPTDTPKLVVRNDRIYPNHTGIGWEKALEMMNLSTNEPTRSEIPASSWKNVKITIPGVTDGSNIGTINEDDIDYDMPIGILEKS